MNTHTDTRSEDLVDLGAASAETKAKIDADLQLGQKVGVQGTPGFIIGDKLYPGAMELPMFKQVIADSKK